MDFLAFFKDEDTCRAHFEAIRFRNGDYCPSLIPRPDISEEALSGKCYSFRILLAPDSMPKLAAGFLLSVFLFTSVPVMAQTGDAGALDAARQDKIEQIEAALEADQNHPFTRLWWIITHTSLTGMFVDRVWDMFQGYNAQRQYNRATDLRQDRVNNTIKESGVQSGVDTKNGLTPSQTLPTHTAPSRPTPTPGTSVSVPSKGAGSGGTVAPSAPSTGKEKPEEEDIKSKAGSAVITAFTGPMEGVLEWIQGLFR